jgi:putative toxin-antitoxin system antitoxin component (TIGR02293 family)
MSIAAAAELDPPGNVKWRYNYCHMARRAARTVSRRIARALGGARVVGATTAEGLEVRLREGLPFASLTAVASGFAIEPAELTRILHLPARTLARRKKATRLRADESDRLFRLGRIAALAEETLGNREKAGRWLHAPNVALGGRAPLTLLDTDPGARQVEDVLLRIAHGVVS